MKILNILNRVGPRTIPWGALLIAICQQTLNAVVMTTKPSNPAKFQCNWLSILPRLPKESAMGDEALLNARYAICTTLSLSRAE